MLSAIGDKIDRIACFYHSAINGSGNLAMLGDPLSEEEMAIVDDAASDTITVIAGMMEFSADL